MSRKGENGRSDMKEKSIQNPDKKKKEMEMLTPRLVWSLQLNI